MKIPIGFTVGETSYTVALRPTLPSYGRGVTWPAYGIIHIALNGRDSTPRTPAQRQETFWHETTHAILHSMGHKLWDDETFVTAFSQGLCQVINTATFED